MKILRSFLLVIFIFGSFLPLISLTQENFDNTEQWLEGVQVQKKYLSQGEFIVSEKGIFVLVDGLPLGASRLNADSRGIFVNLVKRDVEWGCPICGCINNAGTAIEI